MSEMPEEEGSVVSNAISELAGLLECPVCKDILYAPIQQCENGHCVCGGCRNGIISCPVCRGQLIVTRSLIAEQISQTILGRPCENAQSGCSERYPPGYGLENHQQRCRFRAVRCWKCKETTTTVPHYDFEAHIKEVHNIDFSHITTLPNWLVIHPEVTQTYAKPIITDGEYFWYWEVVKNNTVICGVSLGSKAEGSFTCSIKWKWELDEKLVRSGLVHSAEEHPSIADIEPCEKCMCASVNLLSNDGYIVVAVPEEQ